MSKKALEGIRVLDLTHAHAGPICTMFMGSMGAEIIKVEPPWGEMNRMFPPLVKGVSPYFAFLGRSKKGITLDLKNSRGKAMFLEMVRKADVIVENFSPGTMDRLGLGWDVLKEINPNIIFASISGFGQTGPWKDRRSFDPIAQATSGYLWLMQDAVDTESPPVTAPDAIADTIPGLTCLIGILAAINFRHQTGKGQRIDVAQMDAMISTMQSFSFWKLAGTTFKNARRNSGMVRVSGLHKAKDGFVMFSLPEGRITEWLKEKIGVEELSYEIMSDWIGDRSSDEVVKILAETGVPVGKVNSLEEVFDNEQANARNMFVSVDHPTLGEIILPGFPIKFSETPGDIKTPAPILGQHNNEVYGELLGIKEEEIEALRKNRII
jgi:crotonobetainyl-CoA:carnitine CoA-transferase CaiB-like acyl-CoA transferase